MHVNMSCATNKYSPGYLKNYRKERDKIKFKNVHIYKMNIKNVWLNYYIFYTSIETSRRIRPSVHCCILLDVGISNSVL